MSGGAAGRLCGKFLGKVGLERRCQPLLVRCAKRSGSSLGLTRNRIRFRMLYKHK